MKIRYDSEADILLLVLRDEPPVDAIEEPGGVIVSYGEDGEPVSVEFMNASLRLEKELSYISYSEGNLV